MCMVLTGILVELVGSEGPGGGGTLGVAVDEGDVPARQHAGVGVGDGLDRQHDGGQDLLQRLLVGGGVVGGDGGQERSRRRPRTRPRQQAQQHEPRPAPGRHGTHEHT